MRTWCRDLYIRALLAKNKNKKQETNKNNTKQNQAQENESIVGVCSAGMKFCSRAEACSYSH